MYRTINVPDKTHQKLREYCKKNKYKLIDVLERLIDDLEHKDNLSGVVNALAKLEAKERVEVTKQLFESAKAQLKFEELNKSLLESVA